MALSDDDIIASIALARSLGIGAVKYKKLILRFGSSIKALRALEADPSLLGKKNTICSWEDAAKELNDGKKLGAICLVQQDKKYPSLLKQTHHAPALLWVKGDLDILSKESCAIVGSRNASIGGQKIAHSLASNLAKQGFISISGLARGIDRAAHEGSLKQGTIAVIAGGVDHIYPPEHRNLYHDILDNGGAIISENPPISKPKAILFPRRNRIISGLSQAVVIVEAGLKSGSLTTADFAIEQNKELFAVPGSPLDPRSAGTNKLLRNGASWAESSQDIIEFLQNRDDYKPQIIKKIKIDIADNIRLNLQPPTSENIINDNNFLSLFSVHPISSDEIIRLSGRSTSTVLPMIAEHELMGDIQRLPGNMFVKS